jgi:AbrB family transcriptional regulator (stage V sporulation protein T)
MLPEPGRLQKNPSALSVAAPANGLSGRRKNGIYKWHLPLYTTIMVAKLTLDKAGRMVLPKALRDELQLSAGDTLEAESSGEQVTLRPLRATTPLQKERGVWVYRTGQKLPASVVNDTLRQIRDERHRAALGKKQ